MIWVVFLYTFPYNDTQMHCADRYRPRDLPLDLHRAVFYYTGTEH